MIEHRHSLLPALHQQMEADRLHCQRGMHDMLATVPPVVVVCRRCRTLGVCLWCGWSLPLGACITVCSQHLGLVRWQAHHPHTVEAWLADDIEEDDYEP